MNENFEYKIATKDDIDAIIQFLSKDYYETSRALKDPCKMIFLAYSGEIIIGIVELLDLSNISFIYVSEDYIDTPVQEELLELAERFVTKELTAYTDEEHLSFFQNHDYIIDAQANGRYLLKKQLPILPRFSSYDQVLEFIEAQKDRVYSLDNFKNFMYDFYDPQTKLTCVHIGGTNGKGSTTNYTKQVLKTAGYKVGTFTSPALVNRLDIIRVNDDPIDEETIVRYANRYMDDWMAYELSKFEIEVFIAVMYFIEQGVDIALFEVGLGGTLDATNIISPLLSVNTNIGLDHINYLGNTYSSIAKSKAGIIKRNIPYMTAETRQECLEVFYKEAHRHHSYVIEIKPPKKVYYGASISYDYHGYHISLSTSAHYQVINSALSINILEYIRKEFPFKDADLEKGMHDAIWEGRFETISTHPLIIVDGAHNREGMDAFFESARSFNNIKVIFSALKDKDTHHMLETLLSLTKDVTVTEFDHPRRARAQALAEDFPVKVDENWHHAVDEAYSHQGVIFITGSLYFISKVRQYILSKK